MCPSVWGLATRDSLLGAARVGLEARGPLPPPVWGAESKLQKPPGSGLFLDPSVQAN